MEVEKGEPLLLLPVLEVLLVAVHELIDTASGIDELHLTSVERVRAARDFELDLWVSLTIDLDRILSGSGRADDERLVV